MVVVDLGSGAELAGVTRSSSGRERNQYQLTACECDHALHGEPYEREM